MKRHSALFALLAAVILCGGGGLFLWQTGFFTAMQSVEGVQAYIEGFAPYSHLVFFLFQFLSVVLAPIPSNVSALAGGLRWRYYPTPAGAPLTPMTGLMLLCQLALCLTPAAIHWKEARLWRRSRSVT